MSEHPEGKRVANSKRYRVKRRTSSARVTRYLVILFAAAFFLLLMAMLMQHRANKETINDLTESMTSIHSLQNMVEVNNSLTEENAALKEEIAALKQEAETARQEREAAQKELSLETTRQRALHTYNNIRALYNQGRHNEARQMIEEYPELEAQLEEYSKNVLSSEERELYDPLEAYRDIVSWLY